MQTTTRHLQTAQPTPPNRFPNHGRLEMRGWDLEDRISTTRNKSFQACGGTRIAGWGCQRGVDRERGLISGSSQYHPLRTIVLWREVIYLKYINLVCSFFTPQGGIYVYRFALFFTRDGSLRNRGNTLPFADLCFVWNTPRVSSARDGLHLFPGIDTGSRDSGDSRARDEACLYHCATPSSRNAVKFQLSLKGRKRKRRQACTRVPLEEG